MRTLTKEKINECIDEFNRIVSQMDEINVELEKTGNWNLSVKLTMCGKSLVKIVDEMVIAWDDCDGI